MSTPVIAPPTAGATALPIRPAAPVLPEGARITQLRIDGMTCGACATRIEQILGALRGVSAEVNYATGTATVVHPATVSAEVLIAVVEDAGYTAVPIPEPGPAAADGVDAAVAARLIVGSGRAVASAALAVPVLVLSLVPAVQFPFWQWVALALSLPVVLWGAWPVHRAAAAEVRRCTVSRDLLVSLGTGAALAWAVAAAITGGTAHVGAAAGITAIVLAGRCWEDRVRRRAGAEVRALTGLVPTQATLLGADGPVRVPADQVAAGDLVYVADAERIPVDGLVVDGAALVDAGGLGGAPVPVQLESEVHAGGVVRGGELIVRASRAGAATRLARTIAQLRAALSRRSAAQRRADRVGTALVPIVLLLAAGTGAVWLVVGASVATAVGAAVAVLVATCPAAFGLATAMTVLAATGRAARVGALPGPRAWQSARRVDTVLLPKTGVLTSGEPEVVAVTIVEGADGVDGPGTALADVLAVAGAVEAAGAHPLARAITAYAAERVPFWPAVRDAAALPGGVSGETGARTVLVGSPAFVREHDAAVPDALEHAIADAAARAQTPVVVAWDGQARAVLALTDPVRPAATTAIARFRALGLEPVLVSGDAEGVAAAVAAEVGITRVLAEQRPEAKVELVRALRAEGHGVAVLGDGEHDAPVLAAADIAITLPSGAGCAAEGSPAQPDLGAAAEAIALSGRAGSALRTILAGAAGYHGVALPLAAAGLLPPVLAAAASVAASLAAADCALRLRRG
ncbi:heavy metal translocating P-type ATPase [Pseudonocardia thermophila]|uniref:heavy metal translocating P-type ATPase n=1 Tax=Pseudonocardia thermophila TaxID=1848 RepID=UPI00248EA692|nr:HAD-IC family P-type ATPase [Pseudonocardia thermophila]